MSALGLGSRHPLARSALARPLAPYVCRAVGRSVGRGRWGQLSLSLAAATEAATDPPPPPPPPSPSTADLSFLIARGSRRTLREARGETGTGSPRNVRNWGIFFIWVMVADRPATVDRRFQSLIAAESGAEQEEEGEEEVVSSLLQGISSPVLCICMHVCSCKHARALPDSKGGDPED